jgi:NADPH2:quinone reductase
MVPRTEETAMNATPRSGLQLRSLIRPDAVLEVSLVELPVPAPGPDEVLVRVQATPVNPSDLGLLFGPADLSTLRVSGPPERPVVTAAVPERAMAGVAGRVGESMPVGNEGAGTVVAAGSSPAAQALLGRVVAMIGGAMYGQYRAVRAADALVLPEGTAPEAGASCFVNPLTALGMVETMRREGHTALVHTAAASNLGQMLNRICMKDGIGLVSVVRRPEQVELLRGQGAAHVVDASRADFTDALTDALVATGATLAFDAIGGGRLAGQILACMEAAIGRRQPQAYSRYGSNVHKQVYLYGMLDTSPTEIVRSFGLAWGVGGWLLFPYLQKLGRESQARLRQRVVDELHTTFASRYARTLSLAQLLSEAQIRLYAGRATGAKVLVDPSR